MMQTRDSWDYMDFNTVEEFTEWLGESDLSISDLQISKPVVEECSDCDAAPTITVSTDEVPQSSLPSVVIKSLSEAPTIDLKPLTESDSNEGNTWFVADFESMKDACSTSKILYKDSTLFMNVCESDGNAVVNLVLEVDGEIKRVPFKLKKTCDEQVEYDMILAI